MFRAFNVLDCDWSRHSVIQGESVFEKHSERVTEALETLLEGEIVDGGALSKHWFPIIKADVFISHSHADKTQALKLAGWLKDNFSLEAFIDSTVWGNAGNLLKLIDERYCRNEEPGSYNYRRRNLSTSHVHMMLSVALAAMLDRTEAAFFLNTPQSISSSETIHRTQSPWLFYELSILRTIRRQQPPRHALLEALAEATKSGRTWEIEHEVPLSELTPLTVTQLNAWLDATNPANHALDTLYELVPEA